MFYDPVERIKGKTRQRLPQSDFIYSFTIEVDFGLSPLWISADAVLFWRFNPWFQIFFTEISGRNSWLMVSLPLLLSQKHGLMCIPCPYFGGLYMVLPWQQSCSWQLVVQRG
jgi:hypothetical protein